VQRIPPRIGEASSPFRERALPEKGGLFPEGGREKSIDLFVGGRADFLQECKREEEGHVGEGKPFAKCELVFPLFELHTVLWIGAGESALPFSHRPPFEEALSPESCFFFFFPRLKRGISFFPQKAPSRGRGYVVLSF